MSSSRFSRPLKLARGCGYEFKACVTLVPATDDSKAKTNHLLPESITKLLPESIQDLLPKPVTTPLPEDTSNWPLWQLIVSALGAIAVVALVIGLVLRPKLRLPE